MQVFSVRLLFQCRIVSAMLQLAVLYIKNPNAAVFPITGHLNIKIIIIVMIMEFIGTSKTTMFKLRHFLISPFFVAGLWKLFHHRSEEFIMLLSSQDSKL